MSRQEVLHERYGPFLRHIQYVYLSSSTSAAYLEGLGKDGVVSEEERVGNDVPGGIPWEVLLIEKDAHELGDGEGWVGLHNGQSDVVYGGGRD